jgi:hypothetical protein
MVYYYLTLQFNNWAMGKCGNKPELIVLFYEITQIY